MKSLRGGFTTGSCAAAAAKAAVMQLLGRNPGESVEITLPDGVDVKFDLYERHRTQDSAVAVVVKDAGDDPDITNGAHITVSATWNDSNIVDLQAGEGIGTVTLPGLQEDVGEPAINPVPRQMILSSVRSVTDRGVTITISVPNGKELAKKTFNEKLGIVNGISIIGTTGRVKPFSCEAVREALKCSLNITHAAGIRYPVLVPGNIGQKASAALFSLKKNQSVQAGNDWGYMLDAVAELGFAGILLLGHPGKLAKIAMGHWDTHSSRSPSATAYVAAIASELLSRDVPEPNTVDHLFAEITPDERRTVADHISERICIAVAERMDWGGKRTAVVLVDMKNNMLGCFGDLIPWKGE